MQMAKIEELTLNHGKMNDSRRVQAVPKLKRVGEMLVQNSVLVLTRFNFDSFPYFYFIIWCNVRIRDKNGFPINGVGV
jgi:hypothetical protein